MNERDAASCTYQLSRSTRIHTWPTSTRCCLAERAWAMDTGRLLLESRQRATLNKNGMQEATVKEFLVGSKIAVPGKMTSAFLALQLFVGEFDYVVVPFDRIFDAVKAGRADAGLIIHEGQLTYAQSGFEKVVDLGESWKRET